MGVIVVPDALPREPLAALRVLTDSKHELDRIRREQVIAARSAGASWQQIGDAIGVTRQSAWESFTDSTRQALAANSTLDEDDALELAVDEVRAVRRRLGVPVSRVVASALRREPGSDRGTLGDPCEVVRVTRPGDEGVEELDNDRIDGGPER